MLVDIARSWWLVLLRGLLAIGFGVLTLAWPGLTILTLVVVFGAYALVDGVLDVALAIGGGSPQKGLTRGHRVWLGFMGLIGVAAGLVTFFWPAMTAIALLWVIAWWAILHGVVELFAAWRLRAELTNEWMWVLAGLLSIALGIVLLVRPGVGALAVALWIGILALGWGLALCIVAFRLRGIARPADATA